MVTAQARDTTQPGDTPTRATRPVGGLMGTRRPHDSTRSLPVSQVLVFPVSNQVSTLAWEFDQEAAAADAAGGSWSHLLAWSHRRAAGQLRAVLWLLHHDPTTATVRMAQDWRDAAQAQLADIRAAQA